MVIVLLHCVALVVFHLRQTPETVIFIASLFAVGQGGAGHTYPGLVGIGRYQNRAALEIVVQFLSDGATSGVLSASSEVICVSLVKPKAFLISA